MIDLLREKCTIILKGNCDEAITRPDIPKGRFWTRDLIGEERASFIYNLPVSYEFYMSGYLIRLFHASPFGLDYVFNPMFSNKNTIYSATEIVCDYLKTAYSKYKIYIPWYIMTSTSNYFDTINFFEQNNYFDYDRNNITFFNQENLPIIDVNGKLVLSEIYKINLASNGNGNLFSSLKRANLIKSMEQKKLQWLFVGGVDNVLLNPLDPVFIGYTISTGYEIGSKTLFKSNPSDISWIFARRDKKPAIVDCENFTEELSKITDNKGNYLYRETNMLAHLFSLNAIKKMSNVKLSYHRAFRKNAFVNEEGMKQVPDKSNIYKFEQFVFSAFSYFDNIALLRVNTEKEFAPIKDFNGPHNPEVATQKYEELVLNHF